MSTQGENQHTAVRVNKEKVHNNANKGIVNW